MQYSNSFTKKSSDFHVAETTLSRVELISISSRRCQTPVFLSARHGKPVVIARNRSVCIGRRAYLSGSQKTRHLTRSRRQCKLALTRRSANFFRLMLELCDCEDANDASFCFQSKRTLLLFCVISRSYLSRIFLFNFEPLLFKDYEDEIGRIVTKTHLEKSLPLGAAEKTNIDLVVPLDKGK